MFSIPQNPTRLSIFALLAIVSFSSFSAQAIQRTDESCYLTVASRPTLSEAKQYIIDNVTFRKYTQVFQTQNRWFSIVIGELKPEEVEPVMGEWKASGRIPEDSYCTTGHKFIEEVDIGELGMQGWRHGLPQADECAIVIASRETADEVQAYIDEENRQVESLTIYRAKNGWLAVSTEVVKKADAKTALEAQKAEHRIPADSQCMGTGLASQYDLSVALAAQLAATSTTTASSPVTISPVSVPATPHSASITTETATAEKADATQVRLDVIIDWAKSNNIPETALPRDRNKLKTITKLDLRGHRLTEIPPELGTLHSLERLNLSKNKLTSIPAELGELRNLRELWLSRNQLAELPFSLGELEALTMLDLSHNQLKSVPSDIAQLPLRELWLFDNQISELPSDFQALSALQKLKLSNNPLPSCVMETCQDSKVCAEKLTDILQCD